MSLGLSMVMLEVMFWLLVVLILSVDLVILLRETVSAARVREGRRMSFDFWPTMKDSEWKR